MWWEPGGHGNILRLEEEPESSPSESARLGSANADLQLCDFLEKRFLEKEMKLIKKISDFLSNLCLQTSEENSLRECLLKRLVFFNGDEDQEAVAFGLTETPGFF